MRGRALALGLCAFVAVVLAAHRSPSVEELLSISSINSVKNSLAQAARSKNPLRLQQAIEKAEGLLHGLKEARGRVHAIEGASLDQEQTGNWASLAGSSDAHDGKVNGRGVPLGNMLEQEKAALKRSLAENAREMQSIKAKEQMDERKLSDSQPRATLVKEQNGEEVSGAHGLASRESGEDGSDGDEDPELAGLERELARQRHLYREARAEYDRKEEIKDDEQRKAEENVIRAEIQRYKAGREDIEAALGGKVRHGNQPWAAEQQAQMGGTSEESVARRVPHLGGNGVGKQASSQQDFRRMRTSLPAVQPSESIVSSIKHSLGDNVMRAQDLGKGSTQKAKRNSLPGINEDSWWSKSVKENKGKLREQAAFHEGEPLRKKSCHDLYSCVGSFFTNGKEEGRASSALLHLDEQLKHAHPTAKTSSKGNDDAMVSTKAILSNPQQPLWGALDPTKGHARATKLPGVVESRWGGARFWSRLFGTPVQTKHALHRGMMKRQKVVLDH